MNKYHIAVIIAAAKGRAVTPTTMSDLPPFLQYMVNDTVMTHQIPRALRECELYLHEQFSWLSEIDAREITEGNWREWLADKVTRYGEYHMVRPIHTEDHEVVNPYDELRSVMDADRIIWLDTDEEK